MPVATNPLPRDEWQIEEYQPECAPPVAGPTTRGRNHPFAARDPKGRPAAPGWPNHMPLAVLPRHPPPAHYLQVISYVAHTRVGRPGSGCRWGW